METYGIWRKKRLANDSVSTKAQQIGVFMINTILFPIHKPCFLIKVICLFSKPFWEYNCHLSFAVINSPVHRCFAQDLGRWIILKFQSHCHCMRFIKVLAAIAEIKLPFHLFFLALKELVYRNGLCLTGYSVKLSQVISHFSFSQHVLSYNCLFQVKYKHY